MPQSSPVQAFRPAVGHLVPVAQGEVDHIQRSYAVQKSQPVIMHFNSSAEYCHVMEAETRPRQVRRWTVTEATAVAGLRLEGNSRSNGIRSRRWAIYDDGATAATARGKWYAVTEELKVW